MVTIAERMAVHEHPRHRVQAALAMDRLAGVIGDEAYRRLLRRWARQALDGALRAARAVADGLEAGGAVPIDSVCSATEAMRHAAAAMRHAENGEGMAAASCAVQAELAGGILAVQEQQLADILSELSAAHAARPSK